MSTNFNNDESVATNGYTKFEISQDASQILEDTMSSGIHGYITTDGNLNAVIAKLDHKTHQIKAQIYEIIIDQYVEFRKAHMDYSHLNEKLNSLHNEIDVFVTKYNDEIEPSAKQSIEEHNEATKDFNKSEKDVQMLKQILTIHEQLAACSQSLRSHHKYVEAAVSIQKVRNILESIPQDLCETSVFEALMEKYQILKATLMASIEKIWWKIIKWEHQKPPSWDRADSHLATKLIIAINGEEGYSLQSAVSAFHELDCLDGYLKVFAKKICSYFMKTAIVFPNLTVTKESNSKIPTLRIIKDETYKPKRPLRVSQVYERQMTIITFLTTNLKLKAKNPEENNISIINRLGSLIWKELSKLLIKETLSAAIPKTSSQLQEFGDIVKVTVDFEAVLKEAGFAPEDSNELSTYVKNINVNFTNKKCQDALIEARDLMKSDIHEVVLIDDQEDRATVALSLTKGDKLSVREQALLGAKLIIDDDMLGAKTFHFPQCRISLAAKNIMDLVYKTLLDAINTTPPVALQMYYSARSILTLFTEVVPICHKDSLKLPQLAALYYNSCMYLAHHCNTLGHQFKQSFPEPLNEKVLTFVDLVPMLRRSGTKCFTDILVSEKITLCDIVGQCGSFVDEEPDILTKAFSQMQHQFIRLSKVWKDVLPSNIYEISIGRLLDSVIKRIIGEILKLEHISADEATHFHLLFNSIIDRASDMLAPGAFVDSKKKINYDLQISSWQRFKVMSAIMEYSLQDIADQWENKKSVLVQTFEPTEMRILVKALFQNTDRRANVLATMRR